MTTDPAPGAIRPARPEHRGAIMDVARVSGLFDADGVAELEATLDAFLNGDAGRGRWLVHLLDDGAVAAVAYHAPEPMADGVWNLYLLLVRAADQGRGFGGALVRHVERDLLRDGARLLLIETSGVPDFAGQRAFYAGLGYREEARIADFYEPGDDKVVFRKTLQPVEKSVSSVPAGGEVLRVASPDELGALVQLAEDFYREDGFTTGLDQLRINLHHLLTSDAAHVVLAERRDGNAGFAITTTSFGLENGPVAELEDLFVEPASRRRGLAGRLIDDSAEWARRRGCSHLEVIIAPNGKPVDHLDAFYEARGFVDEGRRLRSRALR